MLVRQAFHLPLVFPSFGSEVCPPNFGFLILILQLNPSDKCLVGMPGFTGDTNVEVAPAELVDR
jgi:hypothetical protein